jgi:quercetin dioxygenase-like cupin family protein
MGRTNIIVAFIIGACAGSAASTVTTGLASTTPGEAAVVPLDAVEVRTSPAKSARIFQLARGHNAFLGKLEMDGGATVPLHRDATEEYVHVLEGSGKIAIDGKPYDVAAGTTIYMPANAEVSFENGASKMVAIQVFAGPEPAMKYDAWTP